LFIALTFRKSPPGRADTVSIGIQALYSPLWQGLLCIPEGDSWECLIVS